MKKPYSVTATTTALTISLTAKSLPEVFSLAGKAMFDAIDARKRKPTSKKGPSRIIRLTALDEESLLADWLNELIYLHHTYHEQYFVFDITHVDTNSIEGIAHGIPETINRYDVKHISAQHITVKKIGTAFHASIEVLI